MKVKSIMSKKWTNERVQHLLQSRDKHMICLTDLSCVSQPSITKVKWQCTDCNHVWFTTVDSIQHSNSGCPKCAGNIAYTKETLNQKLKENNRTDIVCLDIIPGSQTRKIRVLNRGVFKCLKCNQTWSAIVNNIVKWHYGCPFCKTNLGKKIYDKEFGMFHSHFEYNCFKLLNKNFPDIKILRQQRYCRERRLNCDFVLADYNIWIECCGTFQYKDPNYQTRLNDKIRISKNKNYRLNIVRTIPEMNKLIKELKNEIC